MSKYLTETKLGEVLQTLYPHETIIHNKQVPSSNLKYRPDYRIDSLKMIIEFDGYLHYSSASKIKREKIKEFEYGKMGYSIKRIPYFVQVDSNTIKHIFNIEYEWELEFPHGFIDNKALLPCDFCEIGVQKFKMDLETYSFATSAITDSLKNKVNELGDVDVVLPPSLQYLIQ